MRVTFCRPTVLEPGGAWTHFFSLYGAYKKLDDDTIIATVGTARRLPVLTALYYNVLLLFALKRMGTEILYLRHSSYGFLSWFFPTILEYNGSEVWMKKRWGRGRLLTPLVWFFERLQLRKAKSIVVVSKVLARELSSVTVKNRVCRVFEIPNGVDTDKFRPVDGSRIRKHLNIGSEVVIGFFGSFGNWHGAEYLAMTSWSNEKCRYLFVGQGPRLSVVKSHAFRNCTFLDFVPHDEVNEYMNACDILALCTVPNPDNTEFFGSPTKLFEYMATGKAIIASDQGQVREILTHGKDAYLYNHDKVRDLDDKLRELVADKTLRERLGFAAREEAKRHTWNRRAEALSLIVRQVGFDVEGWSAEAGKPYPKFPSPYWFIDKYDKIKPQ